MNKVELSKKAILSLKPDPDSKQSNFSVEGVTGLRVRVGKRASGYSHTYFIEQRVNGRLQKKTIGAVDSFDRVTEVKTIVNAVLGDWARGDGLSNTMQLKKQREANIKNATFRDLLETYIAWQEHTEKTNVSQVKNIIKNHIKSSKAKPEKQRAIWDTKLKEIDSEIISDLLTEIRDSSESAHITDQCRQIIKAAYNKAATSFAEDIELKTRWKGLGIRTPILIQNKKFKGSATVRNKSLTLSQLHALMSVIDEMGETEQSSNVRYINPRKAFVLFHIFSGGQRGTQLSQLTASSIIERDGERFLRAWRQEKTTGAITNEKDKRPHLIPLTSELIQCIQDMNTPTEGKGLRDLKEWEAENTKNRHYLWNITDNSTPANTAVLPKIYEKKIQPLMDRLEVLEPSDQLRPNWIRKTVETLMRSQFDTRPDHLGWLQDHGIGGVQNKHYNQYEYLKEKRNILEKWYVLLAGTN